MVRPLFLAGAVFSAAVMFASPAAAAPPDVEPFHVDETFVIPAGELCAFPVEFHVVGHFRVAIYYDRAGNVKVVSQNPSLVDTLTNPLNGKSLTSNDRGLDRFVFNADGTISLLSTAIHFKYQVPGQGVVFADISLRVITFDADFNVISFEVRGGRVDGDIDTFLCAALA